ncbi:adenine-specific methyltransferase EcoRI family protein [Candidatus Pacearchaeota archaeon]|nr:adenine-specific methyltransferase EcoRI family protein [Candidatus Pacearchaeota archaeon]
MKEKKTFHKSLTKAKTSKKDEFYTQLSDIEKELGHYKEHFKNKVIFLNCDDPEESNFWKYFELNFKYLGLKKLVATHFGNGRPAYKLEIVRDINNDGKIDNLDIVRTPLKQNGDFRSPECIEILKKADIIVTNPPFSLFREFVIQLMEYNKKFIIIGHINAVSYKEIFKLIQENKIWLGYSIHSGDREFKVPDDYPLNASGYRVDEKGIKYIRIKGVRWFTNLDYKERHEDLILYKTYKGNEDDYPKYDNYNAINVDVTKEIPMDYKGSMGVPITFMDKYNPDQFEIETLGIGEANFTPTKKYGKFRDAITGKPSPDKRDFLLYLKDKNGKYLTTEGYRVRKVYARIIIKNKKI